MCGFCGDGWRFETTVLGGEDAGRVKAVLHPISFEWEDGYSRPSTGSLVLATEDPAVEDIWPGATGLYISQVMSDGSRRARFGGYITKFQGSGGGATTVAIESLDGFLDHRLLAGPNYPYELRMETAVIEPPPDPPLVAFQLRKPPADVGDVVAYSGFTTGGNAAFAAFLVDVARGNIEGSGPFLGIETLTARWEEPASPLSWPDPDGPYAQWWEFRNIGEMIRELVEQENGVKYRLEHTFTNGYWATEMVFSDVIGVARDYVVKSDREGWQYGLEINAESKATRVYGVGAGDGANILYSIAYDADELDNLPEHQVTVAWTDQTVATMLDAQTAGHVTDHRDPVTVPAMTVVGVPDYDPDMAGFDPQKGFPAPEICQPGDTFGVELGYGVITIRDLQVRLLGVAWNGRDGSPVERVLAMQPVERPNTSVRTQVPARQPAPQDAPATPPPTPGTGPTSPWPFAGRLANIQGTELTEVSGMEISYTNPNHVWLVDDERETPDQVSLVRLSDGVIVGSFNPNPGVSVAPFGDPEALRYSHVSAKLVVADIGDNDRDRPTSGANQPHLLSVTEPKGGGTKGNIAAVRLPIAYPSGQRWNAETLLIDPDTDEVFIVTKEPTRAQVFSFGPLSAMNTTNNVGVLVRTLSGIGNISDGCHTRNGDFVLFRVQGVAPTVVYNATTWKRVGQITTPAMTKSEALAVRGHCAFVTTTEGVNAPLYQVLIPKAFGATCGTVAGPNPPPSGGGNDSGPNGPTVKPGQVLDLQKWKLQLPI